MIGRVPGAGWDDGINKQEQERGWTALKQFFPNFVLLFIAVSSAT